MILKWIKQERFFVLQRSARYATWWYTMGQKAPRKSLLSQKLLKDSHKQYSIKNFLWNPMKNYTKGPIYPLNIDLNDPKIVNLAHCAINGHLAWHARVHEHLVLHCSLQFRTRRISKPEVLVKVVRLFRLSTLQVPDDILSSTALHWAARSR